MIGIKVIIFDVDGTLFNTDEVHFQTMNNLLKEYQIKIDEKFYGENGLDDAIFEVGLKKSEIKKIQRKLENFYYSDSILSKVRPKPNMLEVIDQLAKDYKLAVGSGEKKEQIERYLHHFKLNKFFDFIGHGALVANRKSNPLYFQSIAKFFNVKTENCLMIGDSPYDALASEAGCKTVIIPTKFTKYLNFNKKCEVIFSTTELKKILKFHEK